MFIVVLHKVSKTSMNNARYIHITFVGGSWCIRNTVGNWSERRIIMAYVLDTWRGLTICFSAWTTGEKINFITKNK